MDTLDDNSFGYDAPKERHGCVTAWLVIMIIANSGTALLYLFGGELLEQSMGGAVPQIFLIILAIVGLLNVVFAILLLRFKKIGFFGFILTSLAALGINLKLGMPVLQSSLGLLGFVVLFGILQIKKSDHSAWEHLD